MQVQAFLGFPGGSAGKESACNAGDLGSIPGLGRSPGEGKGSPLQYSGLENSRGLQRVGHDRATFSLSLPPLSLWGYKRPFTDLSPFAWKLCPKKTELMVAAIQTFLFLP